MKTHGHTHSHRSENQTTFNNKRYLLALTNAVLRPLTSCFHWVGAPPLANFVKIPVNLFNKCLLNRLAFLSQMDSVNLLKYLPEVNGGQASVPSFSEEWKGQIFLPRAVQ